MYSAEVCDNKVMYLAREDDYREFFETTKIGIMYLDHSMHIKNLNREAEKICGIDRTQVIGKKAKAVFQNYGEPFLKMFSISEYDDFYSANIKFKLKEQMVYIHVDTLRLPNSFGNTGGVLIVMQDVSAVRAAIKQIQTTKMLMSLGELAAGVAHHVRTPLTTISGYLQVMLGRLEDDEYTVRRDVLETLLDEVSYINNVVKELILFAKPPIAKETGVNINKVLEEALFLTFKELDGDNIIIEKQLASNLPLINADRNLMKQVMMNIMQNAIEAMPGEGTLSIKSWLHADLNMLVIAIRDTGSGVAPEILARIFEPFYTTKLDRMGIGLPIAHRIVAEHGGFINISSDDNRGTKVHIYLPATDDRVRHLTLVHQQILNLQ
ncbi:pas fold [Lucifera butyrica]|uniref:histidine kinase n=1 Tax=Lucifera butyrica TaxID=1351585 RepID=A0A498RI17_9FIRM|nr:ATP-binding protein [Lucifera butyrica]VBB08748.1 pas fold [Lucifera butyrica]